MIYGGLVFNGLLFIVYMGYGARLKSEGRSKEERSQKELEAR
jgi:hypothetical protein